jgi:hypothetical protein
MNQLINDMKTKMTTKHLMFLTLFAGAQCLTAQTPADPYTKGNLPKEEKEQSPNELPTEMSLCYEVFILPLADAAALQRKVLTDTELYKHLVEQLEKGSVKQELCTVLRCRSGNKAKTESVLEYIYATEYESALLPNNIGLGVSAPKTDDKVAETTIPKPVEPIATSSVISLEGLRTPATPTAFETRNTGESLEMELTLSQDRKKVSLKIAPEHVQLVDQTKHGQEFSETKMPEFETRRINTSAELVLGKPFLLGTVSRPTTSKADPDAANRVSFSFVTVNLVKH